MSANAMRDLRETFTDDEFDRLKDIKSGRTWREAILQEFGVDEA